MAQIRVPVKVDKEHVEELHIAHEVHGDPGRVWALTPGGRFSKDYPGLPDADVVAMDRPALVFRSGESDPYHTRETSEQLAGALPNSELAEPPRGDREWVDSKIGYRFVNWPKLAPLLDDWARRSLG